MKKLWAEVLGTFAIVFYGTGSIVVDTASGGALGTLGIAVVFGLAVTAMVMLCGPVSGAHLNPAVSITLTITGSFSLKNLLPYIMAQLSGALAASLVLSLLFPGDEMLGSTMPSGSALQAFMLEMLITFFLMMTILAATDLSSRLHAATLIGVVVLLGALFAGPVCGASMNPARSMGPALVSGQWQHLWIYLLAPVAGAVVAGFLYPKFR
jgi:aquaporin Z